MAKINVLVFPAGEINSVELHDALATCVNINLMGASSKERHGKYVFADYTPNLPLISDADFFEKFNAFLESKHVDVIFPTHDTIATFFADNLDQIHAKVIVADKKTAAVCRDKKLAYELFADCDFVPRIYHENFQYPVFIKPRDGQGAVGARLVKDSKMLPLDIDKYVVCEYLPGEEYTVDCLTDKDGRLAIVSPRSRQRILGGVCTAGRVEELTDEIKDIAETINQRLVFKGLWFFQIKKDAVGKWKLLEISTRCAGTMCLTRARGINLPLLSVYVAMGYDISVHPNDCAITMDRTLISRYAVDYPYHTVYFDFDDTLIVRDKVNLKAIWFLYQCLNEGKKVVLLTKHANEIYQSMQKYKIDKALFDEVIHIQLDDKKSKYVDPDAAIFIDNAYQERADVQSVHHIPVFDVDGIEVLMDWRI